MQEAYPEEFCMYRKIMLLFARLSTMVPDGLWMVLDICRN